MTFGLSVPQAIAAILVGNLTYAFLGFASLQGPKTGTTAFMVSRAPFGQNGNRLVALFNWGTQVGFEIEGVYFVVVTVLLLFARGHTTLNGSGKVGIIILAVAGPGGPAAARARHDQQDLPVHGLRLHRVLRGARGLRLPAGAPVHVPRPPGDARRLDHRAGAAHLGRRPRLDRERERLLALPAAQHPRVQDVLGGGARRRDPVDPARDPRRARLHGHHQDGRHRPSCRSRRRSPAGSWCRS